MTDTLENLRESIEGVLARDVYECLAAIADMECNLQAVLGGPRCGKCGPCVAKPVFERMHLRGVKAGWNGVWKKRDELREAVRPFVELGWPNASAKLDHDIWAPIRDAFEALEGT